MYNVGTGVIIIKNVLFIKNGVCSHNDHLKQRNKENISQQVMKELLKYCKHFHACSHFEIVQIAHY